MHRIFEIGAKLENQAVNLTRFGLVVVLLWIGGLKIYKYEAEGIVPFVANSPVMSFFYEHEPPAYKAHMNKEGELVPENRTWHKENNTYIFAIGLGFVICVIGLLIAVYPFSPKLSAIGSLLCFGMSFVTLSFLITSPETWVPDLGSGESGFPLLTGAGRLVIKDAIMMGAALVTFSHAAKVHLKSKSKI